MQGCTRWMTSSRTSWSAGSGPRTVTKKQRNVSHCLSGRPFKLGPHLKTTWPHQAAVTQGAKGGGGREELISAQHGGEGQRSGSATDLEGAEERSETPGKGIPGKSTLNLRSPTDMPKTGPGISHCTGSKALV